MKTINKYRKVKQFVISGIVLEYMIEVRKFVTSMPNVKHLTNIAPSVESLEGDRIDLYTVRVITKLGSIYDLLIEASTHQHCLVTNQQLIHGSPETFE